MGLQNAATRGSICAFLAVLAATLTFTPASIAQVVSATLTGTVTDSSSAAVPAATVTATEKNTGTVRTTQTSAEGVYSLPFLAPGTYQVDISKAGFKKVVEANIELD